MTKYLSIKCPKCAEYTFEFTLSVLEVKNKVECYCPSCGSSATVSLDDEKIIIYAG